MTAHRILLITPHQWRRPGLVLRTLDNAVEYLLGLQRGRLALRPRPPLNTELILGTPPVDRTGELNAHLWAEDRGIPTRPHPDEYRLIDDPEPLTHALASDLIALAAPTFVVALDRGLTPNWRALVSAASASVETWLMSDNAGLPAKNDGGIDERRS